MNLRNDTASGAAQPHTESAPPYGRTYQAGSSPEKALVKSLCEQCSQQAARLNPPQAANRFSSFEVSKKRACRKASPAFAHVSLKIGSSIPRIGQKHGANHRKGLCRQFLPALAAPACEHVAAVGGAHALAETVNLFPLPNFGLKSHLHSIQYLFLAYLQGNIAICPTHAQRSIFGEKIFRSADFRRKPHSVTISYYSRNAPVLSSPNSHIRACFYFIFAIYYHLFICLIMQHSSTRSVRPRLLPALLKLPILFRTAALRSLSYAQAAAFCFDNIIFQRFFSLFIPVSICYNLNVRKCAGFFVGLTIGLRETNTKEIYHAC